MIYNIFTSGLLIRLVLFAGTSVTLGYLISTKTYNWIVVASIVLIIILINLIHFFRRVNEKLGYFFDAVRNEDSTLHFSETISDQPTQKLHASLNKLNATISDIKIRNEYNERFYRELLQYSATGIVVVDNKNYVELVNNAALRLLGVPALAFTGILKQKNPKVHEVMRELQPGQSRTIKYLKDQEITQLSIKVVNLQFSDLVYRVYSLHDIKSEMEENEVDSWQKLIRVLTHEIMNSVAPITSLSKTMQRFLNFEDSSQVDMQIDKAREGLQVIEETGKGLMHFIDNYRRLTKIPKPDFKNIDIKEWLNRIHLLFKDRMDKEHIQFKMQFKTKQKEFLADEKLLSQVIINILKNAIEAMAGSEVRELVVHIGDTANGKLQISISNTGPYIEIDILDKIFVPFFTTKEQGSGIGLSISRQIMRLHKGNIAVHSDKDGLTTFSLKM